MVAMGSTAFVISLVFGALANSSGDEPNLYLHATIGVAAFFICLCITEATNRIVKAINDARVIPNS